MLFDHNYNVPVYKTYHYKKKYVTKSGHVRYYNNHVTYQKVEPTIFKEQQRKIDKIYEKVKMLRKIKKCWNVAFEFIAYAEQNERKALKKSKMLGDELPEHIVRGLEKITDNGKYIATGIMKELEEVLDETTEEVKRMKKLERELKELDKDMIEDV